MGDLLSNGFRLGQFTEQDAPTFSYCESSEFQRVQASPGLGRLLSLSLKAFLEGSDGQALSSACKGRPGARSSLQSTYG